MRAAGTTLRRILFSSFGRVLLPRRNGTQSTSPSELSGTGERLNRRGSAPSGVNSMDQSGRVTVEHQSPLRPS